MPHGKPLMESSLTKVVAMYHCPIGDVFHKVAFTWQHMSGLCFQALIHQDIIFRILVQVSILGFGPFWKHVTL